MIAATLEPGAGDPVGNLVIMGEDSAISIENTLVDAWLAGMLEGIRRILDGESDVEVDLVDEPWPLGIRRSGGSIRLSYRGEEISVGSVSRVVSELTKDASQLLPSLRAMTESPTLLDQIERDIEVLVHRV